MHARPRLGTEGIHRAGNRGERRRDGRHGTDQAKRPGTPPARRCVPHYKADQARVLKKKQQIAAKSPVVVKRGHLVPNHQRKATMGDYAYRLPPTTDRASSAGAATTERIRTAALGPNGQRCERTPFCSTTSSGGSRPSRSPCSRPTSVLVRSTSTTRTSTNAPDRGEIRIPHRNPGERIEHTRPARPARARRAGRRWFGQGEKHPPKARERTDGPANLPSPFSPPQAQAHEAPRPRTSPGIPGHLDRPDPPHREDVWPRRRRGVPRRHRPDKTPKLEPVHVAGASRTDHQPHAALRHVVDGSGGRPEHHENPPIRSQPEGRPDVPAAGVEAKLDRIAENPGTEKIPGSTCRRDVSRTDRADRQPKHSPGGPRQEPNERSGAPQPNPARLRRAHNREPRSR